MKWLDSAMSVFLGHNNVEETALYKNKQFKGEERAPTRAMRALLVGEKGPTHATRGHLRGLKAPATVEEGLHSVRVGPAKCVWAQRSDEKAPAPQEERMQREAHLAARRPKGVLLHLPMGHAEDGITPRRQGGASTCRASACKRRRGHVGTTGSLSDDMPGTGRAVAS